ERGDGEVFADDLCVSPPVGDVLSRSAGAHSGRTASKCHSYSQLGGTAEYRIPAALAQHRRGSERRIDGGQLEHRPVHQVWHLEEIDLLPELVWKCGSKRLRGELP